MKMRTKGFAAAVAVMLLFTSCGTGGGQDAADIPTAASTTAAPTTTGKPILDSASLPALDGSTACIPLAYLVLQRAGGLTEAQAEAAVDFTKTAGAYERLRYGDVDLILVYEEAEPSAEEEEEDREVVPDGYTEDLELHPLGRDALVFLTSAENPIASLTVQQVKDIYTGKVTNWKEVGGTDAPIVAYQRDADSGSQALMEKLVMQGTPMAKAPQDLVETEMGGLVERIAGFVPGTDGQDGYALGYSVWYYAENMYADPNVKMIPIDGVYPDLAALSAGAYTLLNDFYAGIRKDAPEGGTARALLAWLLSDAGRACVADAGYAPVQ